MTEQAPGRQTVVTPLLATKLFIPRALRAPVPRPQLEARLRRGLEGPLTVVAAPPGSGKTTLVSEGVSVLGLPLAWLSLDAEDSDPARFGAYFVAALQTLRPEVGRQSLPLLQLPQPPPLETILALLVNDIAAILPGFVFVLDDYHVIDSPAVHAALAFLLDHLPPQMHLVIVSRADPPLPLPRWRVRGQLTELRAEDLRFTVEEAAVFLKAAGLTLADEDVAVLEARTEGWIAGLQLAALALQRLPPGGANESRSSAGAFVAAFAGDNRYILDYLTEEVLRRQPEAVQRFLLRTSTLERLTGSLCDAVTGQIGSQQMLETLERANLFVAPLDSQRRWYRYHRLFADLLRYRLQQADAELVPELHRRAAEWLEANSLLSEAVPHALQARAFDLAGRLIEAQAEELVMRGETATLDAWGKALPPDVLADYPHLCVFVAAAILIAGDLENGRQLLDQGEAALRHIGTDQGRTLGVVEAIRSIVANAQGDVAGATDLAQRALDHLAQDDWLWRNAASIGLANSYRTRGDLAAAEQIYASIAAHSRASGDAYMAVLTAFAHGCSLRDRGRLHEAEALHQQTLELARRWNRGNPRPSPLEGLPLAGLAGLNYEWNQLETAQAQADTALELGQQGRIADILTSAMVVRARLQQAQGNGPAALETAEQLLQLATAAKIPAEIAVTRALRAYLLLRQHNLALVADWVRGYRPPPYPLSGPYETEALMLARAQQALGLGDEALTICRRLRSQAEGIGRTLTVIETWILEALALHEMGDNTAALDALRQALRLAEPEGYIRTFVDVGEPLRTLLVEGATQLADEAEALTRYVAKLLAATGSPAPQTSAPPANQPSPAAAEVEPLSNREVEVLRLLAAGCSNQEIADALVISVNTVKAHINRLYAKLDAHTRLEAVERARQLGWL
jgi:LuxR family maltose regulon positive regulatory protein